ncbi:MAG: hypothetical protein VZR28_12690 [Candidatus Cryptobacteroides sp.]|nr:hypothetical protein [Candidatus Cryptobacteroides sp.]
MLYIKKLGNSVSEGTQGGAGGENGEITIDTILVAGLTRGLRMQDTEYMTLGMWVDYIVEWNEMHKDSGKIDKKTGEKVTSRKANQADFDAF